MTKPTYEELFEAVRHTDPYQECAGPGSDTQCQFCGAWYKYGGLTGDPRNGDATKHKKTCIWKRCQP